MISVFLAILCVVAITIIAVLVAAYVKISQTINDMENNDE